MAAASVRRSSLLLVPLLASALQLRPAVTAPPRRVLLFVDPCGDTLQTAAIEALGATVLPINSQATADAMMGREWCDADLELLAPLGAPAQGDELCWAAKHLDGLQLEGVLCGSDAGLADAERLQHVLLPERSNGLVAARRDKYLANEACEAAGMATAAQLSPATWAEAEGFVKARCDKGQPTVLKPRRGTASVGVLVASSLPEAKEMFDVLSRSAPSIDASELQADRTVLQERLEGDEWIVDTVSCGGVHKVVALWRYDKGVANGAPFVYFGAELMPSGEAPPDLAAYACAALDALSWRWGPAHLEVRVTTRGPRLIEVNAGRCNGLDFKLLVDLCYGYNAFDATAAAYLSPEEGFAALPPLPPATLECHARLVTLVSEVSGQVAGVRHLDEIGQMQSVLAFEPEAAVGDCIEYTTNLNDCAGTALMAHRDRALLAREYKRLRQLQSTLFEVEYSRLSWPAATS